jgi:hypothetical protein
LPCGRSYCSKCINCLADINKTKIKCQECGKIHEIPDQGFPPNFEVANILKLKSNEICRSKSVKEFKIVLNSVRSINERINEKMNCGEMLIREKCDKIRNDAQLAIEESHLRLDEFHKKFMMDIDEYERGCLEEFKQIQQKKAEIDRLLSESHDFCAKSESLFKQFQIDEEDVRNRLNKGYDILDNLETMSDKLHSEMFKGTLLKFVKNVKEIRISSIGHMKRQEMELFYVENAGSIKNESSIKKIEIGLDDTDLNAKHPFVIFQPFRNLFFLCLQYLTGGALKISTLDKNGDTLVKRVVPITNRLLEMYITPLINNRFFCVYTEEEMIPSHQRIFKLTSYDENLKIIARRYFRVSLKFIESNNESVFVCYRGSHSYNLTSFNSKLEPIKEFEPTTFYFPISVSQLLVNNLYFIVNEPFAGNQTRSRITLISQNNGIIRSTFEVKNFDNWCLYLNKFILLFSNNSILCYNFDGYLIETTFLNEKKFVLSAFKFALNRELYFLDFDRENNKIRLTFL